MHADKNIYVFLGTKAQYIKTAPLLRHMQQKGVPYVLVDSGQHAELTSEFRKELGVKPPDARLISHGNINTVTASLSWFWKNLNLIVSDPSKIQKKLFPLGGGVCVIHGDTATTLLGLLLAKRARLKVAHIEAGLRSFNILRPFPEELIRIICMRLSDYLFAPSDWAFQNIEKMRTKGKCYNVKQNTNVEAIHYATKQANGKSLASAPYAVFTIHRLETILSKSRLKFIAKIASTCAKRVPVIFVLHEPTKKKLTKFRLLEEFRSIDNLRLIDVVGHGDFLRLISRAEFVVSDGGSIQEECFFLDVPCLIMRSETERLEGLDTNVRLCKFNEKEADIFFETYENLRRGYPLENLHPSRRILSLLQSELSH